MQIQIYPSHLKFYSNLSYLTGLLGAQRLLFRNPFMKVRGRIVFSVSHYTDHISSQLFLSLYDLQRQSQHLSLVECLGFGVFYSFIATSKQAVLVAEVPDSSSSQNPLKSLVVKWRQLSGLFSFTRVNVHTIIIPFTEEPEQSQTHTEATNRSTFLLSYHNFLFLQCL